MIRYTGNPYVDAGVAVLELRLRKPCDQFTVSDLEAQAMEIDREYRKKIWRSYLRIHFFNCAWTQADLSSEKNKTYIQNVLAGYRSAPLEPTRRCVFCCRVANVLADRSHIPLLTGKANMTAGAGGDPGLPVCGYCLFAVHFYPLATLKVQGGPREPGRPLFWWTLETGWTRRLAQRFYLNAQKILVASPEDFINLSWPWSQLLRAAREAVDDWEKSPAPHRPPLCDIVGIHATSSGLGPDYDELHVPRGLLEFWSEAGAFELYRIIEREAWESDRTKTSKGKGKSKGDIASEPAAPVPELARRNRLYEALGEAFRSPDYREKAKKVAVQFFLRRKGKDVTANTTALAEFFLEKVADMEKERLEAIRGIADAIVEVPDPKWIIDKLMRSGRSLYDFVPVMRAVQQKLSAEGKSITWEKFLLALNLATDDDATTRDTWLVSELVLVRVFERLAESRKQLLAEISTPEEVQSGQQTV